MTKKSKKFIMVFFVILLFLILFFYPKNSVVLNDGFTATLKNLSYYENKECSCFGFENLKEGLTKSSTFVKICYGIPYNCTYECKKLENNIWKKVDCE